ncbi:MAG: PLP-dependent enzyme, glutamate decarboxylase [candidate division CPR1 bacterium GW2011_GWA2_42_17]|uniref:PLP-dependent enzyme, glutamate decarboxylase n=1 Tax=candidate division CPR1 bacterium GW2011_GWA2_42_17 TaxID=1618341 RepID=A0A0G0Z699_9BACT|nr:MAG: PLP-dependent enzyme, glutamate decarboxylase [candidate division CPR1 bacterium GW2011_GWA2_42_17]
MVILPKKIKDLFYDPKTDSISSLLQGIKDTHAEILKSTDLSKSTLSSEPESDESAILGFRILNDGLSKEFFAPLIASLFDGVSRWHSPNTMYNVAPPPIIPTVTTKTFTSLYNPNLCLDTASGKSLITEQKVIKAIAEYIGWDWQAAGGAFTWGGKATSMYGIKLGLKKCSPSSSAEGVKEDVIVLSTTVGHPAHTSDSNWLGIGSSNIIRIKTDVDNRVDLGEMEKVIEEKTKEGKKIAAIIISGGTTNNMVVDPIEEVVELRDRLVKKLSLDYSPNVHVDTVVAFPWIFFKDYEFQLNPLNIDKAALARISEITKDLRGLYKADSFGIDFHKMGFCPYISCLFMVKDKTLLYGDRDVRRWPFSYTIENSRPGDGPNSAYVALNILGTTGFQILVAHLTEVAVHLQKIIYEAGDFEVINATSLGSSVMFIPRLPKNVSIAAPEERAIIHNNYTSNFIKRIAALGNPYYLDQMPGNATGANPYPLNSLKAYIMSPHSDAESNLKLVKFLVKLKKEIDAEFDFTNTNIEPESELPHPLKYS